MLSRIDESSIHLYIAHFRDLSFACPTGHAKSPIPKCVDFNTKVLKSPKSSILKDFLQKSLRTNIFLKRILKDSLQILNLIEINTKVLISRDLTKIIDFG